MAAPVQEEEEEQEEQVTALQYSGWQHKKCKFHDELHQIITIYIYFTSVPVSCVCIAKK